LSKCSKSRENTGGTETNPTESPHSPWVAAAAARSRAWAEEFCKRLPEIKFNPCCCCGAVKLVGSRRPVGTPRTVMPIARYLRCYCHRFSQSRQRPSRSWRALCVEPAWREVALWRNSGRWFLRLVKGVRRLVSAFASKDWRINDSLWLPGW
jgi:hypothetical protein